MQTKRHNNAASEREFDRLLAESLDESLAMVLGEIAKKVVYEILENKYDITTNRMPERLDELTSAFETMFGAAACRTILRAIAKTLYSKLGLTFIEIADWRLPDYAREARARMTFYDDSRRRSLMSEGMISS